MCFVVNKDVNMGRRRGFDGIIIAHLGNISGRQPDKENQLKYLQAALAAGYHICVEVVFRNGAFLLPSTNGLQYAPPAFFSKQRIWSRCQDADTLDALCNVGAHAFIATTSALTLTSHQFIWTLPTRELAPRSIAVYPELAGADWLEQYEPAGLCSNEPASYI